MMKSVENTRKKIPFSILDFVIIALALALICGIFARYDIIEGLFSRKELSDADLTFIAEAITHEEAAAFAEGKQLYCEGSLFGTIQSSSEENAQICYESNDGQLIFLESTELVDVSGSIKLKVLQTDDGYMLNGKQFIAAGSTFIVRSAGVSVVITVLSINDSDR